MIKQKLNNVDWLSERDNLYEPKTSEFPVL